LPYRVSFLQLNLKGTLCPIFQASQKSADQKPPKVSSMLGCWISLGQACRETFAQTVGGQPALKTLWLSPSPWKRHIPRLIKTQSSLHYRICRSGLVSWRLYAKPTKQIMCPLSTALAVRRTLGMYSLQDDDPAQQWVCESRNDSARIYPRPRILPRAELPRPRSVRHHQFGECRARL
jgi:hypothetical protein